VESSHIIPHSVPHVYELATWAPASGALDPVSIGFLSWDTRVKTTSDSQADDESALTPDAPAAHDRYKDVMEGGFNAYSNNVIQPPARRLEYLRQNLYNLKSEDALFALGSRMVACSTSLEAGMTV